MPSLLSSIPNNRDFIERFVDGLVEKEDYKELLLNLLAVIHRDGGHYTQLAGLPTSVIDAFRIVPELYGDNAALKARLDRLTRG